MLLHSVTATLNSLPHFPGNTPWSLQSSPSLEATLSLRGLSCLRQSCLCCSRTHKELTSDLSHCLVDNKLLHSKNRHWEWGSWADFWVTWYTTPGWLLLTKLEPVSWLVSEWGLQLPCGFKNEKSWRLEIRFLLRIQGPESRGGQASETVIQSFMGWGRS